MAWQADFSGQTAVVTGAGADVGQAIALACGAAGANVVVNDLNPDRIERVVNAVQAAGGVAFGFQADVANRFQAAALIEAARERFGRLHLWVNAAGAVKLGGLLKLDEWDWRRLLDVNLTGTFFCTQLVSRVMAEEGGGAILNLVTTAAQPNPLEAGGAAYSASKGGVLALTRQSAHELAPHGIRVNALCVANVADDTPRAADEQPHNALGRWGTPDEVAAAALFLCSDAARFITGAALAVDGGL